MNKAAKALEKGQAKAEDKNSPVENETLRRLLTGEDLFETVDAGSRGQFTIKYPRPRVLRQIQVLLAQRFGAADLSKVPERMVRYNEVYATLDVVVVKAPQWWDDLDSSEDCPDDRLIENLYRRYLRFYNRVQSEIAGAGPGHGEGTPGSPDKPVEAPVGDGPLSGLAHGPENEGSG